MINIYEVNETNSMIEHQKLDVRTITMGISLLDCCDSDIETVCGKIYAKITSKAKDLVSVGEEIEKEFGIPIVNKRISQRRSTKPQKRSESISSEDFPRLFQRE